MNEQNICTTSSPMQQLAEALYLCAIVMAIVLIALAL